MEKQIGFAETEALYFGKIVEHMMEAKVEKKKKEKKPSKMKRAELLKRLLLILEQLIESKTINAFIVEQELTELRKVVMK